MRGNPPASAGKEKFTIRAEKSPNRLGVEAVLRHFEGGVKSFTEVSSARRPACSPAATRTRTSSTAFLGQHTPPATLAVIDLFAHPFARRADFLLPAASVFETDGTLVNHSRAGPDVR